ncbi:hypothetical protein IL308_06130 [Lactococcus lactis]|nr:hypothetical protein [Lactococcus lactis]MBK5076368.1 hypothetical protein [Lactococcus lactis]
MKLDTEQLIYLMPIIIGVIIAIVLIVAMLTGNLQYLLRGLGGLTK